MEVEIYDALEQWPQFILWSRETMPSGKTKKFPLSHKNGRKCDSQDPGNWLDFAEAKRHAAAKNLGVGFVLTAEDPFFLLDIDNCISAEGEWSKIALELVGDFAGAAVEVSTSGSGLHIIGSGECKPHKCKNTQLDIELYHTKRFVALTFDAKFGSVSHSCTRALDKTIDAYFTATAPITETVWSQGPAAGWNGETDDTKLIANLIKRSEFHAGVGARFSALWNAETAELSEKYPSETGDYDASGADLALASALAFWTGNDCDRIKRLMVLSKLVREKWTANTSYLDRTISLAACRGSSFYTAQTLTKIPVVGDRELKPFILTDTQYLCAKRQIELFSGCVYVQDVHRVLTPSGQLLKPEQFNATYGGYTFEITSDGEKTSTAAWHSFTESQVVRYPFAVSGVFRPLLSPGELIKEEGDVLVNTYFPAKVRKIDGDAGRFTDLVCKLLPDARDQRILLSYMSAVVQYIGVKFQWAPLVQGVEGNGKSTLIQCVAYAVGRKYYHSPKSKEVGEKFNSWLDRKIIIGVEDICNKSGKRLEVIEALKPLITNKYVAVEPKGVDQSTVEVCANFMFNSNYLDAIPRNRNDRRYSIFVTEQQDVDDIIRDGLGGEYFNELYKWLENDGFAIVAQFLTDYEIDPEFNPAGSCRRAPKTSTSHVALAASLGPVEQTILESVGEGAIGFRGGWISSVALDTLLRATGADRKISHIRRHEMLKTLGYEKHPGLSDGRTDAALNTDYGKKTRLFVKTGSELLKLTGAKNIECEYVNAQRECE